MSYVSECVAHGRILLNNTLNCVREQSWLRWILVLPVVFIGSTVAGTFAQIYSGEVAFWSLDDVVEILNPPERALPVFSSYFVQAYTWVVLSAIVAPRSKKLAATISAALYLVLFFLCWHWRSSGRGLFGYLNTLLGGSEIPEQSLPWLLSGILLALVIVFRRVRPRMMLTLPAYYIGFSVPALLFSIILASILRSGPLGEALISNMVLFVGGFGGIGIAALTSPTHRVRTAIIFLAVTLVYVMNSAALYFTLFFYPDLYPIGRPSVIEPGLIFGELFALGLVIFCLSAGWFSAGIPVSKNLTI